MTVRNIVLGLFLASLMVGVSFMSNADEYNLPELKTIGYTQPDLDDRDVVCAVLSFTAGYEQTGYMYSKRVAPFIPVHRDRIQGVVTATNDVLYEEANDFDGTTTAVARHYWKKICQEG